MENTDLCIGIYSTECLGCFIYQLSKQLGPTPTEGFLKVDVYAIRVLFSGQLDLLFHPDAAICRVG